MKCLIVEDDAVARLTFVEAMVSMGYACFDTDSVSGAEYFLKTHEFEVVLLDLCVTNGMTLSLTDYLDVVDTKATVILITGTGAFPHAEHTRIAPRIDYVLHKPVNIDDLTALVDYTAKLRA